MEGVILPALIPNKTSKTKILYFDIDGTFLDYDDQPKSGLLNSKLEQALKNAEFDYIACVSGWVDIFAEEVMRLDTEAEQKGAMYQLLQPLFPDQEWFLEKLILIRDTDHRGQYIDLETDWYYVDDWADKFFTEGHGEELYQQEKGHRLLLCDHLGDGVDILDWLDRVVIKN